MSEHDEQTALFEWIDYRANQDSRLELAFAVPNGQYRPGQRMEPGLRAGVPDVLLPFPSASGQYCGMALELKHGRNKTTDDQDWWLERLAAAGWYCVVCLGADEAIKAVEAYLEA